MGKIIEQETRPGLYGMGHSVMIVEHPEHGRLLLADGFGGQDTQHGGAYRWEHGTACRIQPDDTLESLRAGAWNESATLYDAVLEGRDGTRPLLHWSGYAVRAIASAAA